MKVITVKMKGGIRVPGTTESVESLPRAEHAGLGLEIHLVEGVLVFACTAKGADTKGRALLIPASEAKEIVVSLDDATEAILGGS